MNKETTPDGRKVITGTLGEIFPKCYELQKDDAKRFACLIKTGECKFESTCFVLLQRAINQLFIDDPELVGGQFVWSTDKKRFMSKVLVRDMIHNVFEIVADKFSPIE